MNKIFKRHDLLTKYFGTKPSEDESYNNAWTLVICSTSLMILFCILEATFYFLYSQKVKKMIIFEIIHTFVQFHPWIKIVKGTILPSEEEKGCLDKFKDGLTSCWAG